MEVDMKEVGEEEEEKTKKLKEKEEDTKKHIRKHS